MRVRLALNVIVALLLLALAGSTSAANKIPLPEIPELRKPTPTAFQVVSTDAKVMNATPYYPAEAKWYRFLYRYWYNSNVPINYVQYVYGQRADGNWDFLGYFNGLFRISNRTTKDQVPEGSEMYACCFGGQGVTYTRLQLRIVFITDQAQPQQYRPLYATPSGNWPS